MIRILHFIAILLTAVAMAAGWAHLLELPNKMGLSREEYLIVQQIYRGWALLGIVVVGALISTAVLAVLQLRNRVPCYSALTAALCIALSLIIFFSFTFPANIETQNWTMLPEEWEALRRQWEYSHAAAAILYFAALAALTFSVVFRRH
ncbi:MAG: hypothetical protein SCH71_05380 [Desulfobulbaceae bacterium]|nr:hypothetical protein [Desulfobulbaceae bacterium]